MPKRLIPSRWPHFMEKRFKASYHSGKILGQLYDKVESAAFIPIYDTPFDKRILEAYKLDNATLKAARQVKSAYDTHMRRIMAQHGIKTEFEVWSTFVLSRPRVGSDYKVQEMMSGISDGLKDQFRLTCYERAGGKDFSVIGPFAAAMYKVTKEEMDFALAECRQTKIVGGKEVPRRKMKPHSMPLISFPWIFERELGRIATGKELMDDLAGMEILSFHPHNREGTHRQSNFTKDDPEDYVEQGDGVLIHRGEVLDIFRNDPEFNQSSDEGDFEESQLSFTSLSLDTSAKDGVDKISDKNACSPFSTEITFDKSLWDISTR